LIHIKRPSGIAIVGVFRLEPAAVAQMRAVPRKHGREIPQGSSPEFREPDFTGNDGGDIHLPRTRRPKPHAKERSKPRTDPRLCRPRPQRFGNREQDGLDCGHLTGPMLAIENQSQASHKDEKSQEPDSNNCSSPNHPGPVASARCVAGRHHVRTRGEPAQGDHSGQSVWGGPGQRRDLI